MLEILGILIIFAIVVFVVILFVWYIVDSIRNFIKKMIMLAKETPDQRKEREMIKTRFRAEREQAIEMWEQKRRYLKQHEAWLAQIAPSIQVFDADGNHTPEYAALSPEDKDYVFKVWSKPHADTVLSSTRRPLIDQPAMVLLETRNTCMAAYLTYDDERLYERAIEAEKLIHERARMAATTKKQAKQAEACVAAMLATAVAAPVITLASMYGKKVR